MRLERVKNAKQGIFWGLVSKSIALLCPFIVRTVLIKILGVDYLGLSGLFTSILQVLNLAELGFSSAIVYSMYKPISEDDYVQLSALLNYYKFVYRIIGLVILLLGLAILPFLPCLISGNCPADVNVYVLYLIYLCNTCLSYFLFAYRQSLLTAYQRVDVYSIVRSIVLIIQYLAQCLLLLLTANYYVYIIVLPLITIVNNIAMFFVTKKLFPQVHPKGHIADEQRRDIRSKIYGLTINKVCIVSRNAIDNIALSATLGLTIVGIYSNYFYVVSAITGIMAIFPTSMAAGIGNSLIMESKKKNYDDFNMFVYMYSILASIATTCLVCLIQPFMHVWVGQELMFPSSTAILFAAYFYLLTMGDIRSYYTDALGLWYELRWFSIVEIFLNLILIIVFIGLLGVNGVIIATIISTLFVNFFGASTVLFTHYFKLKQICKFFTDHGIYFLVTVGVSAICMHVTSQIAVTNFLEWGIEAVCVLVICSITYCLAYCKSNRFKRAVIFLKERVLLH